MLGQSDLGLAIPVQFKANLWSVQKRIASAISVPRSKVIVPSCNASGKTMSAARIALAFYEAYTPGAPCAICGGPCGGGKVITTSSKHEHLRDNLWGEIRSAYKRAEDQGLEPQGNLLPADLRLEDGPNHLLIGQSSSTAEGMQGYHAAHKLIIGDEATAVDDEVQLAITRLLATGDSRLLLIFNPTDTGTYAAKMARASNTTVIPITAWDTPNFTGEPVPPGANLITPAFLDDLKAQGMGPGTFEWVTSIEAKFWDMSDDRLIAPAWYDQAEARPPYYGTRQIGVDMASYGSDENVIAFREGGTLKEIRPYPSMRQDSFWRGPVLSAVMDFDPDYLVYDADGVGAGVIGEAEAVHRKMRGGTQVIAFRGGKKASTQYLNARSAWYWALRRRFEHGTLMLEAKDPKLREQLLELHYSITQEGKIRVETKSEMKKRGVSSPDRADAIMYAFALAEDLPMPHDPKPKLAEETFGLTDHSEAALWERLGASTLGGRQADVNPVFGVSDDY